jgi:hypothetical protein
MIPPHSPALTVVFHLITLNFTVILFRPFPTLFLATSSSSPYQLSLFLVGLLSEGDTELHFSGLCSTGLSFTHQV